MAFVTLIHCTTCGKDKTEVTRHDDTCNACRKSNADKKRRQHLASLKGLTVEERLEKIEAHLYDLDAESRIGCLEIQHRRYV